ncbi:MAG: ribose 1,5-bisphosphate isomerase [Candidatus Methanomethylophilaceae archaeon]|jgi:ribose 1,5-bisphosphate isomerase
MNVDDTAAMIKDMTIRGAGKIARTGVSALSDFVGSYEGRDMKAFRKDLEKAKKKILDSRPTAVSLWNGVHATLKGVEEAKDVGEAISLVQKNAREFIENSTKAVELIGKIGAKRIQDGDTVMTHCNSSAALSVIKTAYEQGKHIKVYATESRPWRQGILTVNDLGKAGIDTTLVIDSAVRTVMTKVDKVFVGADTITSHGVLVNKIGTSQLALSANEARVQFYVCSETYKFSPMTLFGDTVAIEERGFDEIVKKGEIPDSVKIYNPVFDVTPAKYIDAIITELGVMSPGSVYDVLVRQLGERIFQIKE